MKRNAAVWIDREHAFLVLMSDNGEETTRYTVDKLEPFPLTAETRAQHAYTPKDFLPEGRMERKAEAARHKMYDSVLASMKTIDTLLVIGPGEAKSEFAKYLDGKGFKHLSVSIETADKMTEPQLVAMVRQHFATTVPR